MLVKLAFLGMQNFRDDYVQNSYNKPGTQLTTSQVELKKEADKIIRDSQESEMNKDKIKTGSERDWNRTEARRYHIVTRNEDHLRDLTVAPDFSDLTEDLVAQQDECRKVLSMIYRHFERDLIVTSILDLVLLGDADFTSDKDLSNALEITIQQVRSAKRKLKYFSKSLSAELD